VDLTNDDVAEILALLDSLPYDELDLETPRFRLTLRRAPGGGWTEESQVLVEPAAVTSLPNGAPTASAATAEPRAPAAPSSRSRQSDISEMSGGTADGVAGGDAERAGMVAVPAPLPGTFYRAPRPGAAPFVEVGDEVAEDTVVAIVETMKLMNSVHAGTRGRVAEICLDNGELAVQGVTLMWIEPAP
jgi:acetyl-CoA carboxylase biotin carboxyl carrier protein